MINQSSQRVKGHISKRLIQNLLNQKKDLEGYEREVFRKRRYASIRQDLSFKSRGLSTRTPEVLNHSEIIGGRKMKSGKVEECGRDLELECPSLVVSIKKISRVAKPQMLQQLIMHELRPTPEMNFSKNSTVKINARCQSMKRALIQQDKKINQWSFTPL